MSRVMALGRGLLPVLLTVLLGSAWMIGREVRYFQADSRYAYRTHLLQLILEKSGDEGAFTLQPLYTDVTPGSGTGAVAEQAYRCGLPACHAGAGATVSGCASRHNAGSARLSGIVDPQAAASRVLRPFARWRNCATSASVLQPVGRLAHFAA